jgi:hypothetical protein
VLKNRVLGIFGPRKEEVTRGWRKLRNMVLHNLYSSPNNIGMVRLWMRWAGHVVPMGEMKDAYSILVRKPKVKR